MSILFALLTFLLLMTISHYRNQQAQPVVAKRDAVPEPKAMPAMVESNAPANYYFHPGHTWAVDTGADKARIGIDSFTTSLLGTIDEIKIVPQLNHWVRQGQKLLTITSGPLTFDMVSPVEGVLATANSEVLSDPKLAVDSPFDQGWICTVMAPDMATDFRNLMHGPMVGPWMKNSISELASCAREFAPALAQDGGTLVHGGLRMLTADAQKNLVHELFLT